MWDPVQYGRFREERSRPFFDLLTLVRPVRGGRVLDLGCGDGSLTARLHEHAGAASTLGIDSSADMLAHGDAAGRPPGVTFACRSIESLCEDRQLTGSFDVVFSNAALHWVDDHPALFAKLTALVAPGGQLAVQVPANFDHPSHAVAARVADEPTFREALQGWQRHVPLLTPEVYALLLARMGYVEQRTRLEVYLHRLDSTRELVEWVKGTLLTDYQRRLPGDVYTSFLARYEELLRAEAGDESPYLYPFKRLLLWGSLKPR